MAKGDVAKFIGGFGEAFLKVLQDERKRKQELEQFQQKLAEDRRQFDLTYELQKQLRDRQLAQYETEKQLKEYDISKDYQEFIPSPIMPSAPEGFKSGTALNKQFEGLLNPFDPMKYYIKPTKTEPKKYSDFIYRPDIKRYVEAKFIEGQKEPIEFGTIINPSERGSGSGGSENQEEKKPSDFDSYVAGLEEAYNTYKSMASLGKLDDPLSEASQKRNLVWSELVGKSEGLIANTGLDIDANMMWELHKKGYAIDDILNEINNFRKLTGKPELNNWQEKALRIYYKTRTPQGYNPENVKKKKDLIDTINPFKQ